MTTFCFPERFLFFPTPAFYSHFIAIKLSAVSDNIMDITVCGGCGLPFLSGMQF